MSRQRVGERSAKYVNKAEKTLCVWLHHQHHLHTT